VSEVRTALLVYVSTTEPREGQANGRNSLTTMNADEPDDFDDDDEDEDEDDDDSADKGEGGEHDDDDENGWEDDEDGDEPETWQVVDFPAGNCLDLRDFPAQPGWRRFGWFAWRRHFSSLAPVTG
jgi:hypothetical protein